MSIFIWICFGLGLVLGLLNAWANNQNKINENNQQNGNVNNGFNSKNAGIILIILAVVLLVGFLAVFPSSISSDIFSSNKKYEEIARQYVEQTDYSTYMTLVDTSSYSLDKEVRVTLKYRFTEGPNTSYVTYTIAIDKDTEKVVGFSQY